jgi:8-oxo-dGTP pyrophosphatase MutT (NUDIX family)
MFNIELSNYMQKKPDCWYNQSGVIPYRLNRQEVCGRKIEVLLITSKKRKHWVVPKGIIELSMTPQDSAAKEAFEEAGITGCVSDTSAGAYTYTKWGGTCRVEVFPFEVTAVLNEWPESDIRDRQWMSIKEAASRVRENSLKDILRKLPEIVFT